MMVCTSCLLSMRPSSAAQPNLSEAPQDALRNQCPRMRSTEVGRCGRHSEQAGTLLDGTLIRLPSPVSEHPLPPLRALDLARKLGRQGRPFAAHEVLEARWKAGPDTERDLWQGLAQICVGLTHAARGNTIGATRLLERGAARIDAAGGGPAYGLDLTAVAACARRNTGTSC
jgi:hypothetical protein